jgi:predicted RND superfamily exporter protein
LSPTLEWLSARPWTVVLSALGLSLIALLLCVDIDTLQPRLRIDPSIERLLPAGSEDSAVFARARQIFGDSDALIVAVSLDEVFSAESLAQIQRINDEFARLPDVRSVFSLATAPNLIATGDDIELSSFTAQAARDPGLIAGFPAQLAANPLYQGSLISADGKSTAFAVLLAEMDESSFAERDYPARMRAIVGEVAGEREVWITGTQVVRAETSRALVKTLKFTIPAVFLLIALLLLLAFRSLRATLMAVFTVMLALLWTLATAVLLKMPLNLITAIVPPLVITIGLSYTIHLLSSYFLAQQQADLKTDGQRVLWTMVRIRTGVSLSAATTIAGFLALLLNNLPAVKQFAILSSIGTVYCAVLTLLFLPASLNLIGCSRDRALAGDGMFSVWAERLAAFDIRYRGWIIAVGAILVPLDMWFATDIRTGTEYIRSFDENSEVRRDFEAINQAFNGANGLSIFIETNVTDSLTDPDLIRRLDQFQGWLRQQPEVGAVASYVDYLKLINQGLNENQPEYFVSPESTAAVKQLLVFAGSDDLQHYIDARFRSALISVRINVDGSIAIGDLVERIEHQLELLPPPLYAKVTGSSVVATRTVHEVARGHFESIAIAILAMWLLMSVMFTSWRAGLIATLPNLVPVAVYFGALGLLDIPLNPTTSMVACIVLGIAVNDTIHYLARFNADARSTGNEKEAIKTAMVGVLRPITYATAALCLGFLAFTGGELSNQIQFGGLAAFTLFVAWIADMTLTPALGSRLRIVTLWDLARLDLGQSPQHTIPLLSGWSLRQSRIFALMSNLENLPAGTLVLKEGDLARDMYVILDGSVEVWVDRHGEVKGLTTLARGAVMGEAGYFGQRRTANATAVTPVRLLRFDSQDLERLRVRYPWIAATIFRNLNRIQAERIARMTAMLQ